jgi:hypothetical protein
MASATSEAPMPTAAELTSADCAVADPKTRKLSRVKLPKSNSDSRSALSVNAPMTMKNMGHNTITVRTASCSRTGIHRRGLTRRRGGVVGICTGWWVDGTGRSLVGALMPSPSLR